MPWRISAPGTLNLMRIRDADVDEDSVTLRTGKGGRVRVIPLVGRAAEAMNLLREHRAYGVTPSPPHRSTRVGNWRRRRPRRGPSSGPMTLRHSFGTAIYAATGGPACDRQDARGTSRLKRPTGYTLAAVPAASAGPPCTPRSGTA